MPIPSSISDLSTTPASNSPLGSEPPTEGDNHIRALAAILRQTYDETDGVRINVLKYIPQDEWAAIFDGTSTYDATADIASAITAAVAASPCTLVFGKGTYRCDDTLGTFTGSDVKIDLNGATLDFSNTATDTTQALLHFTGTYSGSPVSLSSDAAGFQKTVACVSTTFAVGDMVRIYSEMVWDPDRTSSKAGELNVIETVPDGTSVTTKMYLAAAYVTSDSAAIEKITPCQNITVCNGKIVGASANDERIGLQFTACTNLRVENISSFDMDKQHLRLIDCAGAKVSNCHFEESNHATQAYGISFSDATQDCVAEHNTFVDVRHSLSTNNQSAEYGVVRRILFSNNVVTDSATATGGSGGDAIDAHACSQDIFVIGNTVYSASGSGVNIEGTSCIVSGNFIMNAAVNGITIQNYSDVEGYVICCDNTVRGALTNYGIAVLARAADIRGVVLSGNNVKTEIRPMQVADADSGNFVHDVSITGNVLVTTGANTGLNVEQAVNVSIVGNSVQCLSTGIVLEDCTEIAINGNSVRLTGTGTTSYGVRVQGTSQGAIVTGNTLHMAGSLSAAVAVSFLNSTVTYSGIYSNVARAFTAITKFNVGTGTGNAAANNIEAP